MNTAKARTRHVQALVIGVCISVVLGPRAADGRQLTTGFVESCRTTINNELLDLTLEQVRVKSTFKEFNEKATEKLKELSTALQNDTCSLPIVRDRQYRLIWIGANQKGEEQLFHVIVRGGADPFLSQRVKGAWHKDLKLIDVFLTSKRRTRLAEEVGATATQNPDVTRLSDLLEKAKLTEAVAFGLGNLGAAPSPGFTMTIPEQRRPTGPLYVQVITPNVPIRRGTLEIRQTASIGFDPDTATSVNTVVTAFLDALPLPPIPPPPPPPATPPAQPERDDLACARDVVKSLGIDLAGLVNANASCSSSSTDADCDTFVRLAAEQKLVSLRAGTCKAGVLATGVSASVLSLYRSTVLPRPITTVAKLTNIPVSKVSYSALTAVMGSPKFPEGATRVKESNGVVAVDNLPRLLTAVVINFHPLGYEPSERTWPTWRESFRVFVGPTINPEPGVAAGIAFGISRNFGLAVGGTYLAFDAERAESPIGSKPVNTRDPFKTEWLRTGFVGFQLKF
jgi:hypothetical protein